MGFDQKMTCVPLDTGYDFKKIDNVILNAMYYINLEFFALIAVTHLIHLGFKRLGQPIIISAILAGFVTGESCLRRERVFKKPFIQANHDTLSNFAEKIGASFMLFIALHLDFKYIWRTLNRIIIIVFAPVVVPIIVCVIMGLYMEFQWSLIYFFFFVHTYSPIAVRIITELKLVSTEIGQLAILTAITNDLACIVLVMFSYNFPMLHSGKIKAWKICVIFMIVVTLIVLRPLVRWLNKRNQKRRYIRNYELLSILAFLVLLVFFAESVGVHGALICFLIGSVFPREGATIRTLRDKLRYLVHNFVLPVNFGWTSSRINIVEFFSRGGRLDMMNVVFTEMIASVILKVGGTLAATTYFKIPFQEGLALGFILNVKCNVDILSVSTLESSGMQMYDLTVFLMTTLVNTLVAGATGTILARTKKKTFKHDVAQGLKHVGLNEEIQVLACVHNPIEVSSVLTLARLSIIGVSDNPFSIMILNLIRLPKNHNNHALFYNQRRHKDDYDDEDSLGYEYKDVPHINAYVDSFVKETGYAVRQITSASFFDKMHEPICQHIYDFHRTLVLIPSHKEQRYDGKMVCRKEDRRRLNFKVLKEATCTIGILIDRPVTCGILHDNKETDTFSGCLTPKSNITLTRLYHVVAIFCGGPDDQEAMEYAGRLAMHPETDVTVLRFLSSTYHDVNRVSTASSTTSNSELAMIIHKDDEERYLDDAFMKKFQQRFITPGYVKYIEMYANNGTEIERAMKSMVGMYSLFIVGMGRQPTAMTVGLSQWQECIEIGPIGDMLSSDVFMNSGSVLVIQCPNIKLTNKDNNILESMFQSI